MTRESGDNSGGIGSASDAGSSGGGVTVGSSSRIPSPRWLGKRVGRFKLLALLGQGAMGRVFRAEDTLMGRHVALKLLPKTYKKGGVSVGPEMLINEARAAAAIEHPSAVQIYEVNQVGDVCYVAMELLEGGSLRDLVRAAGAMEMTRACLLCAEAAEALAAAHAAGVIHRDVKPANLMLSRQGRCKVVDFGLARLDGPGDWGSAAESVGTPQFIAPEILSGTPASAQSDIYSLGGTLWYLLTGSAPYQGRNAKELLRMHLDSPVPDLRSARPEAPPGLAETLKTALAKRPQDRFTSMEQFARVLRVNAIPIAASAESLGLEAPQTEAEPPVIHVPLPVRQARPASPMALREPEPNEQPPEPEPTTEILEAAPQMRDPGWPLLVGAGVVIAAVVAVLCIALLRPAADQSAVQSAARAITAAPAVGQVIPAAKSPAAAQPEALPPSLVARWVADDYETGNNWLDRVRRLPAVQFNLPVAVPNAFNGHPGVQLNGKDQYFVINASDDPVPNATKMTLVAVFKPNAIQKALKLPSQFWEGGGLIGGDVKDIVDDFGLSWGGESGAEVVCGAGNFGGHADHSIESPDLEVNRTHVAVMVWDCADSNATLTLYVDGVWAGQETKSAGPRKADIPIALGNASADAKMFFSGMLAEIRIYNDSKVDVGALSESLMRTYVSPHDRVGNPFDPNNLLGH